MNKITKEQLFKRQITLSEIGEVGQQKLQNASVLIVGCGGLGSPIAVQLAASGIGKIHLVDFDVVDITNLHRQVFYSLDDVGKSKAECLSNFIQQRAPFTEVIFSNTPVTKVNVFELISEVAIVIDGTDSLPTKYLLNDACVLKEKSLVYGSLYKFDGYVANFNLPLREGNYSTNLRDAFPTMATDIPNCEEAGTLNSIVSLIAAQQVNEVLKIVTGVGKPLTNELLVYNSLHNSQLKMKLHSSISKKEIESIFKNETYFDASCEVQNSDWLISSEELKKELSLRAFRLRSRQAPTKNLEVISVLENLDLPFKVDKTLTISQLQQNQFNPELNKEYVLVCKKGLTSYKATKLLKEKFPKVNILSLSGGINAF